MDETTRTLGTIDGSGSADQVRLSGMLNLRALRGRYLLEVDDAGNHWMTKVLPDDSVHVGLPIRCRGLNEVFNTVDATMRTHEAELVDELEL